MSGEIERGNRERRLDFRLILKPVAFVVGIILATLSAGGIHMREPWDTYSVVIMDYGVQLVLFCLSVVLIRYVMKRGC